MKPWLKTWLENRLQNWRDAEININWEFIFLVFITLTPYAFFVYGAINRKFELFGVLPACGISAAIIAGWCLLIKTAVFVSICLEDLWKYCTHTKKRPSQLEDSSKTELLEAPLRTGNYQLEAALDQSAQEVRRLVGEIHKLEDVRDAARVVILAWQEGQPLDQSLGQLAGALVKEGWTRNN